MRFDGIWRAQWEHLRAWLIDGRVLDHGDVPSVLTGWSVGDLVAHLGRGFATAGAVAVSSDPPLTIRQYVTGYAGAAGEIEAEARAHSATRGPALVTWLDQLAGEAFAAVRALEAPVVRGPRGPIARDDFVLTRVLELVVHADDLARSVPDVPGTPLDGAALAVVATALADAYAEVAGRPPSRLGDLEWIRVAAGRLPASDPHLPLL